MGWLSGYPALPSRFLFPSASASTSTSTTTTTSSSSSSSSSTSSSRLLLQPRPSCGAICSKGMAWYEDGEADKETRELRLLISPTVPSGSNASGNTTGGEGCFLSLRHPRSGQPTSYLLMDGSLKEMQWFKQSYGSWFLGDYACQDGSLYISTPVDPIFILLPLFDAARMKKGNDQGMFRQLEEILYVDGYPCYQQLSSVAKDSMHMVCEIKEIGSSYFYRLDNTRVLTWLCCKVRCLKQTLHVLDKNYAAQEEKEILKDTISILGEYLEEPWLTLIYNHLKLDLDEALKEPSKTETSQTYLENTLSCPYPTQGKSGNVKSSSSNRKPTKKQKIETDSRNIKDMFSRATRKRH